MRMKKLELKAPPLTLQAGHFVDEEYQSYNEMAETSTQNWEYQCTYELHPKALTGRHQILSLENMLISMGQRPGGMMHDVLSAKDSISFAVQVYVEDKATFDKMKLKTGDIMIFDDSKSYNYMTNQKVELAVVTISNDIFGDMLPQFKAICMHKLIDTNRELGRLIKETWRLFTTTNPSLDFKSTEKKIFTLLVRLNEEQKAQATSLTKGEEIAYTIRKQLYKHMDGNLKIGDLANQHDISEKGLQNSFKSLFGFTPKLFMRKLKLNIVKHELSHNTTKDTTVIRVANKWGFMHMGNFSNFYTQLFGENPSKTLKRSFEHADTFKGECVERQEEIL